MAAGEIVVSLLAKTGSFDTDIQRSTKAAEKRMKEMKATADAWGAAIGAAFAAAGAGAVYMAKQIVDGVDALNDLADATGASIENISALEDVAARTGTSYDAVAASLIKFNDVLKDAEPGTKAAGILERLGLHADELRKMDPAQAMHEVAKALAQWADDGDKARAVQELFGKSVKDTAAFLKDLADQGELVATVTTEQAKQAEAFNQQLFAMQKNVKDIGRSIMGDLLPALNAWATVLREGGILGFLGLSGNQMKNPGAELDVISGKLQKLRADREALDPNKSGFTGWRNRINDTLFGDVGDLDRQIKLLEAEQRALKALQQNSVLSGLGDTSDAVSRRLGGRPSLGPLPGKPTKSGAAPRPPAQPKPFATSDRFGAAEALDRETDMLNEAQEAWGKYEKEAGEALAKVNAEYQQLLTRLLDAGPAAQLEKQRTEMQFLADAFLAGRINADQFNDAATGALNLTAEKVTETKSMTEELGMTFASAFEQAALGGGSLKDVFKGLLQDIARVILRMQVIEPMMKQLKASMGGGGGSGAEGWFKTIVSAAMDGMGGSGGGFGTGSSYGNMDFGGYFADGGIPPVGKVSMVGERGPELFVPRTAGMIVPNHALGGGENITIVNQTTGRIDRVQEQRISPTERALIIQESREAIAADFGNPNSRVSRSFGSNFKAPRSRS